MGLAEHAFLCREYDFMAVSEHPSFDLSSNILYFFWWLGVNPPCSSTCRPTTMQRNGARSWDVISRNRMELFRITYVTGLQCPSSLDRHPLTVYIAHLFAGVPRSLGLCQPYNSCRHSRVDSDIPHDPRAHAPGLQTQQAARWRLSFARCLSILDHYLCLVMALPLGYFCMASHLSRQSCSLANFMSWSSAGATRTSFTPILKRKTRHGRRLSFER